MITRTSKIKFLLASTVLIILVFGFVSCTPESIEKIDVDTGKEKTTDNEAAGAIAEEEMEEFEEVFEFVDYDNAQIGADIKGYIPFLLCTDADNYIKIDITNTSDFTWRSSSGDMVRIGYHYYGQDVDYSDYDSTTRTPLPDNLEPGETATVEVLINDITNDGLYVVQIDPVLEGHFWFSSKDVPMLQGRTYFGSCTD
jgi:hypothetical protein